MCGIAGIVAPAGIDPNILVDMTHLVAHRGPDGFGFAYYDDKPRHRPEIIHDENRLPVLQRPVVGLGSRRLAILDLSKDANMPMQVDEGAYSVTYNGEIYNYVEVRKDLEKLGYHFQTGADTEVLLRAYQEWGEACVERFNGMWGFALWDRQKQLLFCSRDRFGVKPFYYATANNQFFFGSEIKQLVRGARLPRIANATVVFHFLEQCLLDHSENTFFEGIYQLRPGHTLTLHVSQSLELSIRKYWELAIEPEREMSEEEVHEEFSQRWENAVRLRLRSDVPVGSSLSGGIDSSAVLCQARNLAPSQQFHTFSSCIEQHEMDERPFISIIGQAISSKEHLVFPKSNKFWNVIESISYHQDEPLLGGGVYAQWCVMAEARKNGIPVLLGGQGGDETLCGYQKYRYFYLWQLLQRRDPRVFHETIMSFRNGTRSSWAFSDASRYLPKPLRTSSSVVNRVGSLEFRNSFQNQRMNIGVMRSIAERQKMDLTLTSIPSLLHWEDRNSMAHSVETRLPFLDYKLVEFAVNCPVRFKLRDGWSKWILRQVMKNKMPDEVRLRKSKLGFDVPQKGWMLDGLQNGHRFLWDTQKLRMERFLEAGSLARETKRFVNSERESLPADFLFRAISLELWAHVYDVA